jgi:hypothetical protein
MDKTCKIPLIMDMRANGGDREKKEMSEQEGQFQIMVQVKME